VRRRRTTRDRHHRERNRQDQDGGRLGSDAGRRDCSDERKEPLADLSFCDLHDADLTFAALIDAILCHTFMPDGQERNDNCDD
jgi:hypothetical protein